MKANLLRVTTILALGALLVAPAMAFDVCGNGYCCTWCIPDERLYCTEDCGSGLTSSVQTEEPAPLASTPAEEVCTLDSTPVEAPAD